MAQPNSAAGTGDPASLQPTIYARAPWRTPKGNFAEFSFRSDTSDWNTIQSCVTEDEYGFRDLSLTGWALDIGAHIGGATVALALDNPKLRVIAVEAVPLNAELLRRNVEVNHLEDRVRVIIGAAGAPGTAGLVPIAWGFRGSEIAEHHAFIGNANIAPGADHETSFVACHSLDALVRVAGGTVTFAKIDCEGCEASFLTSPAVAKVAEWRGEWHPPHIDEAGLHALLDATHEVTTWGPGPGGFRAVRR